MNKSKIYSILILLWLFLLSSISFAYASTPNYCGIETNDTFTWNTTYDEGPLKDRREDIGEEEGDSESEIEEAVDELDTNEDLTQLKIVILDVDDEEKDPWGEDGVRIIYNVYFKEEGEDWDLKSKDETFAVWDYDDDVYTLGFFILNWKFEYDEDKNEWEDYKYLEPENPWFISTKVDWGEVKEEIEEFLEDDLDYDDVSVKVDKDENRLEVSMDADEDDEVDERSYIMDYDDNGVLELYVYAYDGDPIVIIQSQASEIRQFINENILWIIIGSVGIVAVIVIIIIVVIKRR